MEIGKELVASGVEQPPNAEQSDQDHQSDVKPNDSASQTSRPGANSPGKAAITRPL